MIHTMNILIRGIDTLNTSTTILLGEEFSISLKFLFILQFYSDSSFFNLLPSLQFSSFRNSTYLTFRNILIFTPLTIGHSNVQYLLYS